MPIADNRGRSFCELVKESLPVGLNTDGTVINY